MKSAAASDVEQKLRAQMQAAQAAAQQAAAQQAAAQQLDDTLERMVEEVKELQDNNDDQSPAQA